jgi:hypothetical protein
MGRNAPLCSMICYLFVIAVLRPFMGIAQLVIMLRDRRRR